MEVQITEPWELQMVVSYIQMDLSFRIQVLVYQAKYLEVQVQVAGTATDLAVATGYLYITHDPATFSGNVYNYGQIKVTGVVPHDDSIFIRLGNFYNYGTYISDPQSQYFTELSVGQKGVFQGGAQDQWIISGNFINQSTQNLTWNTVAADLIFIGGGNHQLYLPGSDQKQKMAGYSNNFAWGSLDLTGQTLTLADGNDTPGGALYVGSILGVTRNGGKVTDIFGNGLDIYYNPDLAANAYLDGLTYDLINGGQLAPVAGEFLALGSDILMGQPMQTQQTPLPASCWLFLSGLVGLGLLGRKQWRGRDHN